MNVRWAKPFGVRVGELVDRLEALSYRHGRPQFAISYCIVPAESLSEHSFFAWTEPRRSAPVPGRRNARRSAGMERFRDRGLSHPFCARGTGALRHLLFRQALNLRELWLIRCRPGGSRAADWSSAETCPQQRCTRRRNTEETDVLGSERLDDDWKFRMLRCRPLTCPVLANAQGGLGHHLPRQVRDSSRGRHPTGGARRYCPRARQSPSSDQR